MDNKNEKIELKDLEIPISNHPLDKSPRIIDCFIIYGYEKIYLNANVIKDINNNEEKDTPIPNEIELGEYKCKEYPTVLSSITSNLDVEENGKEDYLLIQDFDYYLDLCIFDKPTIYYTTNKEKKNQELIKPKESIPSIINDSGNTICYSYMFYEEHQYDKIILFIPKIFCIVSKYPYYNLFHEICIDIYQEFNKKVQIPLEVQIFNIVNQTPPPNNCNLKLCLFPYQELNEKTLNQNDYFNTSKYVMIESLTGYNRNQINIGWILNQFDINLLIEIFIHLTVNSFIWFYSCDSEKLFALQTIFNSLLYPIKVQNVSAVIPYGESDCKYDQQYCGIKTNEKQYNELKKNFKDKLPDYYVFLDDKKKELKLNSTIKNKINIYDTIKLIVYEDDSDSKLNLIFKKLRENLDNLSQEILEKKLYINYFETNNEEIKMNRKIRNLFYKLNLDLSNFVFKNEKEQEELILNNEDNNKLNNEDIKEAIKKKFTNNNELINNIDNSFYLIITESHFEIIKSFADGNEDLASNNMRLPRKIFASFLSYLNSNPKENREIDYYKIIDNIYCPKKPDTINFNFFEFYKYYYKNMDKYFSEIYNSNYVECSSEEDTKRHFYKYLKVELDPELIIKYIYLLEEMEGNKEKMKEKNNFFKNEYLYSPNKKTKNLDIFNEIENYYYENNLLNYKEMIRLCLINYIILTIPKKKLVYLNKIDNHEETPQKTPKNFIYDLFDCIYLFKNKYLEMFLSVAYRYFNNTNETNYYLIQPYIDVYQKCVLERKILRTEEIISLYSKFKSFSNIINQKYKSNHLKDEKNRDLINENTSYALYSFEKKNLESEALSKMMDQKFDGKLINEKIIMNCKYEPKKIICNDISSPKKLYSEIKNIMNDFYETLQIKDNKKECVKEIGVNILYYCYLIKFDDIPIDTIKYILLTLND